MGMTHFNRAQDINVFFWLVVIAPDVTIVAIFFCSLFVVTKKKILFFSFFCICLSL